MDIFDLYQHSTHRQSMYLKHPLVLKFQHPHSSTRCLGLDSKETYLELGLSKTLRITETDEFTGLGGSAENDSGSARDYGFRDSVHRIIIAIRSIPSPLLLSFTPFLSLPSYSLPLPFFSIWCTLIVPTFFSSWS